MYCSNCGSKAEDGALFCSACGCSLSQEQAAPEKVVYVEKKEGFFAKAGSAFSFVKNKWKTSTGKERSLWLTMLVLGIYIVSPVDILPGVEIDDIIAFIGLAGSYGLLNGKYKSISDGSVPPESTGDEVVNQAAKMAKTLHDNKKQ